MAKPTLTALIDAGSDGLRLRNPDNGFVFRAVYTSWHGVLSAVRLYPANAKRPAKSPIMSHAEMESWLAGLEHGS